jgi:hypothetical protein
MLRGGVEVVCNEMGIMRCSRHICALQMSRIKMKG